MRLSTFAPLALALFAACSSSSSSSSSAPGAISAVVQDLGADPFGLTTLVSLSGSPSVTLTPGHFQSDGGQTALAVSTSGSQVTVTWDDRVTPSHRVRIVGVPNIATTFATVTTTDATVPSFTIAAGQQNAGLGNDSFEAHFSGPQLVETLAEAPGTWRVAQNGAQYPLSDATIDYDPATGVISFDLGASTSLHAAFTVTATGLTSVADVAVSSASIAGSALGDSTAPTLVSVEQNLSADEFGRVVDFTFSEAMDPVKSLYLANFVVGLPVLATNVAQVAEGVLRVTFTEPVIPGVDTVQIKNLTDLHGNVFANTTQPVANSTPVANDFTSAPELRSIENEDNDLIVVTFDQALDPADADDDAHWTLVVDAVPFDLSTASFDYDFLAKSLTIDLGSDFLNGTAFTFEAKSGNEPLDVDGQSFTGTSAGTVAGDSQKPRVSTITQNRSIDPTGLTLDVLFTEAIEQTSAETPSNWSLSGLQPLLTATLQADLRTVRLVYNAHVIPGETTLSTVGITDYAGNAMLSSIMNPILSTDNTLPTASIDALTAVEGANNDTLVVGFDDDMIESEVEDPTNWLVQSPVGTVLDLSTSSFVYDAGSDRVTVTLVDADLESREIALVALSNMRDLGGNVIGPFPIGDTVVGDTVEPTLVKAWVDGVDDSIVRVQFSEPVKGFDDIFHPVDNGGGMTFLEVRDSGDVSLGFPSAVTVDADLLGIAIDYDFSVTAASDVLHLYGVLDLAGNDMFPVVGAAIAVEDLTAPALDSGVSAAASVSGEENDSLTVVFDQVMSPWGVTDATQYDFAQGGSSVDLANATITFDGASTVTFAFDKSGSDDLLAGVAYTLTVSGVETAFGVPVVGSSVDSVTVAGDALGPDSEAGGVRLAAFSSTDTVLADFDEAILPADGGDVTAVDISAVNPTGAALLDPRTSRLTFGTVNLGDTVNFQVRDRAGNLGLSSELVTGIDVLAPTLGAVAGISVPGIGGDLVTITFAGLVDTTTALDLGNYVVSQGSTVISLTDAVARYRSTTNTVVLHLADGVNLADGVDVTVVVVNVENHAGLAMAQTSLVGATAGDSTAPGIAGAFLNYREDFLGRVVDVQFDEDVQALDPLIAGGWTSSGGQLASSVQQLGPDLYRVTFATALSGGETLTLFQAEDPAGNQATSLTVVVLD